MKSNLLLSQLNTYKGELKHIPTGRLCVTTINAHSYNMAREDEQFAKALLNSDILLPDGMSIIIGKRLLTGEKIKKIAGEDFFNYEMNRLNQTGGVCFFLGSSNAVLDRIRAASALDFPRVEIHTYSPPFKPEFSPEDNEVMLRQINDVRPDVVFVGMTAPKQEKWAYEHFDRIQADHVVCIGAVFDFYAGTISRAPKAFRALGLEWLYRLAKEPKRMWRRYLIGNPKYLLSLGREFFNRREAL